MLLKWGQGDETALGRLIPLVERELHQIARRCMAGERAGNSLQATALVNEAYLRLINAKDVVKKLLASSAGPAWIDDLRNAPPEIRKMLRAVTWGEM